MSLIAMPASVQGRIGPNAIVQCTAALQSALGDADCAALMQRAGLQQHLVAPPRSMVDEGDVQALHRAMRLELGTGQARTLGRQAGLATGDYLLAHRVPRPLRTVLPRLPWGLATRVLLAAVSRHAWTFCGSGRFAVHPPGLGVPWRVSLQGSATSRGASADEPLCDYFAATFERLFQALVSPRARVVETACMAMGAPACVFEVIG